MKKTIVILFLAIGFVNLSFAQKESQKSYKRLKSRSKYTSTSELLNRANALKDKSPAEALDQVQEALALSTAESDDLAQAKCYVLIGEINENIQEWKLALENYFRAYQLLSSSFSSSSEYQKSLKGLGKTNLKLANYEESLKYYKQVPLLKLSDPEKEECQLDISEVYYQMGDYKNALKALSEIVNSSKALNTSFDTRIKNQRAKVYAQMNELDKTQNLYSNSLNQSRANKSAGKEEKESIQETKEEIATVLRRQKKYDEEIKLRNEAIDYNLESNNFSEVTKDKVEISKTLAAKGEDVAALKELEEAVIIADTLDDPKEQANAFLALANQYEKNGKNNQALASYKKYSQAVAQIEKRNETKLLAKSELIKKQRDIEELTKDVSIGQREETIERATVVRQQLIIYGLLLILGIAAVTSYFIYRNAQASKLANQLLALKSLRSQMNPHFIFNALNSVNHFIAEQDERTANKFLSEFSQLMRLVLEHSQEDFISLSKEQEILTLYLKLEHYRFRDKFDYEIEIDEAINAEAIEVPPMLIQPYIENAVWHGLRYKEEKGKLLLNFKRENGALLIEVIDNGIGRKKSTELKTENQRKHHSTGLKNIQERLSILNKVYKSNYKVTITDINESEGTSVKIYLPIHAKNREWN
jgi:tetratricopeptide (TPR) repeat protein